MGCGTTLHLNTVNGFIVCLNAKCPDEGAAQKILSDPESEHIVFFGQDSFTVRHPLRDRLGDLPACPVHTLCAGSGGPPGGKAGEYRARVDDQGRLELEAVAPAG